MTTEAPTNTHTYQSELLRELSWRGFIKDVTDAPGLDEHLGDAGSFPRKIYAGFDPTADSLTIGNLVPIMMLAHVKKAGHTPVVLMGGGTGLIGDPSGKSAERQLMTRETVALHIEGQRPIFEGVLGAGATIVNNADWLTELSYLDVLRDVGKHFSVNMMIQKDSVKSRLENREQGISYTEFSYMILQAYDFLHLFREDKVTVQFGGSDQYGNIVAGADLIRRETRSEFLRDEIARARETAEAQTGEEPDAVAFFDTYDTQAFGLTAPLLTKADGGKFGKTESGAVWLTADRTSPYAYYQFWLNADDADAERFLKLFTFMSKTQIADLMARHNERKGAREAQRTLARHATTILHGEDAMEQAELAGKALFSGDLAGLSEELLNEVFASVPSSEHARTDLGGEGADLVELLVSASIAKSKREAREFIANGSVSINGEKVGPDDRLTESRLLHGSIAAIRRGKKTWHVTRWV